MDSSKIDYSPLAGYNFWGSLLAALRQTFRSKRYWVLNITWAVLGVPYLILTVIKAQPGEDLPLGILGYFPLFLLIWVWYYFVHLRNNKLEAFAKANDWTVRSYEYGEVLPSCLAVGEFGNGVSKILGMNIDGTLWDLFVMDWPSRKQQMFTVFRTSLSKEISPMILDSLKTKGLLTIPRGWKRINLEGNFPKYFGLHIPENSQIGVLSYLAPDLMLLLTENNELNDIEITNDYLFVISDHDARNEKSLETLIPALNKIYKKVLKGLFISLNPA